MGVRHSWRGAWFLAAALAGCGSSDEKPDDQPAKPATKPAAPAPRLATSYAGTWMSGSSAWAVVDDGAVVKGTWAATAGTDTGGPEHAPAEPTLPACDFQLQRGADKLTGVAFVKLEGKEPIEVRWELQPGANGLEGRAQTAWLDGDEVILFADEPEWRPLTFTLVAPTPVAPIAPTPATETPAASTETPPASTEAPPASTEAPPSATEAPPLAVNPTTEAPPPDDADAKAAAEEKARLEAEAQAKADADAKAQADADAKAQADADAKARADADAKTQADAKAQADAEAKAQAVADSERRASEDQKAREAAAAAMAEEEERLAQLPAERESWERERAERAEKLKARREARAQREAEEKAAATAPTATEAPPSSTESTPPASTEAPPAATESTPPASTEAPPAATESTPPGPSTEAPTSIGTDDAAAEEARKAEEEEANKRKTAAELREKRSSAEGLARVLFEAIQKLDGKVFGACWCDANDLGYVQGSRGAELVSVVQRARTDAWNAYRRQSMHDEIKNATFVRCDFAPRSLRSGQEVVDGSIVYSIGGQQKTIPLAQLYQVEDKSWKVFKMMR